MNEQLLRDIGLTKGEITVYLTLLKIGETTTGKIIEEAQISSGKIYEILDKLIKKGLASFIIKDKTKYFSASSPNRILDYIHDKEKDLKKKEQDLIKELPNLLRIEKELKKGDEVFLFKGFKGIETAIFEALNNTKSEMLAMGVTSKKNEKYDILWKKWHKQRISKKIKSKIIFSEDDTDLYRYYKKMKLMEVKVLKGITPVAVDIIGDAVLIVDTGEDPSCLYIKNKGTLKSFTNFFYSLWEISK